MMMIKITHLSNYKLSLLSHAKLKIIYTTVVGLDIILKMTIKERNLYILSLFIG